MWLKVYGGLVPQQTIKGMKTGLANAEGTGRWNDFGGLSMDYGHEDRYLQLVMASSWHQIQLDRSG